MDQFRFLKDLDLDAVLQPQVDAITRYADLWLNDEARNQPIRMNGKTFQPEVGQGWFSKTRAAWKAISQIGPSRAFVCSTALTNPLDRGVANPWNWPICERLRKTYR